MGRSEGKVLDIKTLENEIHQKEKKEEGNSHWFDEERFLHSQRTTGEARAKRHTESAAKMQKHMREMANTPGVNYMNKGHKLSDAQEWKYHIEKARHESRETFAEFVNRLNNPRGREDEDPADLMATLELLYESQQEGAKRILAQEEAMANEAREEMLEMAENMPGVSAVDVNHGGDSHCRTSASVMYHPLYPIFTAAIAQCTHGKGERHGGCATPFLEQPWAHYAKLHGRGFLTGQAAKKLEEAASTREGQAFIEEMRGVLVYAGMAILKEQEKMKNDD